MIDINTTITIDRPVHEVAHFAADPDNASKWYLNTRSVRWLSQKPIRVGSTLAYRARFSWLRRARIYQIKAYRPNEAVIMVAKTGLVGLCTEFHWQSAGQSRAKMSIHVHGEVRGLASLFPSWVAARLRTVNEKSLRRLKARLEKL